MILSKLLLAASRYAVNHDSGICSSSDKEKKEKN